MALFSSWHERVRAYVKWMNSPFRNGQTNIIRNHGVHAVTVSAVIDTRLRMIKGNIKVNAIPDRRNISSSDLHLKLT